MLNKIRCLAFLFIVFFAVNLSAAPKKKKKFKRNGNPVVLGGYVGGTYANISPKLDDNRIENEEKPNYFLTGGLFTDIRFTKRTYLSFEMGYTQKGAKDILWYNNESFDRNTTHIEKVKFNYITNTFLLKYDLLGNFSSVCIQGKCFSKFVGLYALLGLHSNYLLSVHANDIQSRNADINKFTYGLTSGIGIRGWFWTTQLSFGKDLKEVVYAKNLNYSLTNYAFQLTFSIFIDR